MTIEAASGAGAVLLCEKTQKESEKMAGKKKLVLDPSWCICVAFCPKQALELAEEKVRLKPDGQCVLCGQCELRCPDYAIWLEDLEE